MQNTKSETIQSLTLKATDTLDLLTGAAIAAHAKDDLTKLNAVYLSAKDGHVKAVASDRYRIIEGKLIADGELDSVGISLTDVKRIISTLKDLKLKSYSRDEVTITRAGDVLSVAVNGSSLTARSNGEEFVPYEQLFTNDRVALPGISFNPKFMADFAKVPCNFKSGTPLKVEFTAENKPIVVTIPHDSITWRALLMPMRGAN